jgi:hypothetical protein
LLLGGGIVFLALSPHRLNLPADQTIATEGFGTPLRVGLLVDDARTKAGKLANVTFLSREQLATHDLYAERAANKDTIAVIYSEDKLTAPQPWVQELRAYLAPADKSKATLHGQPAAALKPDDVKALYGKPYSENKGIDARTHLTYYFADPANPKMAYKLITSHEYDGHCFSMAVEYTAAPE